MLDPFRGHVLLDAPLRQPPFRVGSKDRLHARIRTRASSGEYPRQDW